MYVAKCPECSCTEVWKGGIRKTSSGDVQRYICKRCGHRFSEDAKSIYASSPRDFLRQTSAQREEAERLGLQRQRKVVALSTDGKARMSALYTVKEPIPQETKGKIIEYSFWLLKNGYAESTIKSRTKLLRILAKRGADMFDFESVKETIVRQVWSNGRKGNAVDAYTCFLRMLGKTWEPPIYNRVRKLPFIPTENEIDQLIAGCGSRTATLLQMLKETGMRIGEAWRLQWTDVDFAGSTVRATPEKGSNPRMFKLSGKLMAMLNALQRKVSRRKVFGKSLKSQRRLFEKQRRTIARKLKNERIKMISFHTFRHFYATMLYHKTKDILYVMQMLGHKSIKNTLIYTQLVDLKDDEYVSKVARTVREACKLVEAGFEYVTEVNDTKIFRKRK